MNDFLLSLRNSFAFTGHGDPFSMAVRLLVAAAFGSAIAWVYGRTRRPTERADTFPTTLILLAVLIALVTQIIGDNVARAFSLVGALSIVRFRTVVRDTRDTAFVIFSVVTGMAVGAQNLWAAGLGVVVVGAAAFVRHFRRQKNPNVSTPMRLLVRVGLGPEVVRLVAGLLTEHCSDHELVSVATVRQGVGLEYVYDTRLKPGVTLESVARALNRTEGVMHVEFRRADLGEL